MEELILKAKTRKIRGKENKKLRKNQTLPAVVYGHAIKSASVAVNYSDFQKVYTKAGESSLIDLIIDDRKPVKAIIQDIQYDAATGQIIHADFHQVTMTEKITTEVVLKFINEAPAVKELAGVLVKNMDRVKITCLPADLVHQIEIDLAVLKTFDDIIYIKDLKIPEKIEILEKSDEAVVKVLPPRSEEELKALEEKPEEKVEEVEKVEKEKKEGDEEGEEEAKEPDKKAPKNKEEKNG
ncbi:MAG: 50S ribosomal protein L25 [Patescibacteria group bacterium]